MIIIGWLSGFAVTLLGVTALAGWLPNPDWLPHSPSSTKPVPVGTALCFLFAGIALLISPDARFPKRIVRTLSVAVVIGIAGGTLIGSLLGMHALIDAPLLLMRQSGDHTLPAHMALQAAGAMLATGIIALMLTRRLNPLRDALIHGLLIMTVMVGVSGIIGHAADLPILYQWSERGSIAPLSAVGIVLVALSSGIAWRQARAGDPLRPIPADDVQRFVLFNLLAAGILAIGLTGIIVLTHTVDRLQTENLENIVRMQSRTVQEELQAADVATDSIAGRPYLVSQLKLFNEGTATEETVTAVRRAINSIVINHVEAMAIYSLNGKLVAQRGNPESESDFDVALDHTHRLLWHKMPTLRRTIQMTSDGELVATAVVDVVLPNISSILQDAYDVAPSAETALCGAYSTTMVLCMPQRHRKAISQISRVRDGKTLPIGSALDGQRGTMLSIDYRQQPVIAAYAPIRTYPLGIVTKVDRTELSTPVQDNFQYLVAALSALLVAAVLAYHLGPNRATRLARLQTAA